MAQIVRKGKAIVETRDGILVVAERRGGWKLPGGHAKGWETKKEAMVRELREETGLKARRVISLFRQTENRPVGRGRSVETRTKVFRVEAEGTPEPHHEITRIAFWRRRSKLRLVNGTRETIQRYLRTARVNNKS